MCLEVVKDGLRTNQKTARSGLERHEDVHVNGCDGFKIERCSHRPTNGVPVNHPIRQHLVDGQNDLLDLHFESIGFERRGFKLLRYDAAAPVAVIDEGGSAFLSFTARGLLRLEVNRSKSLRRLKRLRRTSAQPPDRQSATLRPDKRSRSLSWGTRVRS